MDRVINCRDENFYDVSDKNATVGEIAYGTQMVITEQIHSR